MSTSEILTLIGIILALVAHVIYISHKISRFIGETQADRQLIREDIASIKEVLKETAAMCKTCNLRSYVEKVDDRQREMRDKTLPDMFGELKDEISSLKTEVALVSKDVNEIKQKMRGARGEEA